MIRCEIEDTDTGCTYIKEGESVQDCIKQVQDMFFFRKQFKILWSTEITKKEI